MADGEEDSAGDAGTDGATRSVPPSQRPWQHPSEVGHQHRVHADRRRGRVLVLSVVAVGAGVMLAASLLARQGRDPTVSASATGPLGDALARVERLDGGSDQPITGLVIDRSGHVVVPEHLVGGATELRVYCDGGYSRAKVVASDPVTDLAVLRLAIPEGSPPRMGEGVHPADSLTLVSFAGDGTQWSRQVQVDSTGAETVRADGSVVHDLVATTGASVDNGVLADARGRLAGWVTATGGDRVMAYTPASVMGIARHLLEDGHVPRSWIGVRAATVDPGPVAQPVVTGVTVGSTMSTVSTMSSAAPHATGAAVLEVEPGGPAVGHLRVGDVIVSVQGRSVTSLDDLVRLLDDLMPGDRVALGVRRVAADGTVGLATEQLDTARLPA